MDNYKLFTHQIAPRVTKVHQNLKHFPREHAQWLTTRSSLSKTLWESLLVGGSKKRHEISCEKGSLSKSDSDSFSLYSFQFISRHKVLGLHGHIRRFINSQQIWKIE